MRHMELALYMQTKTLQEAYSLSQEERSNADILQSRGVHVLTAEENTYYNAVITAQGFETAEDVLMPKTVIDRVFEDLRKDRPLLAEIDFVNTTGVTEWVVRTSDAEAAWWGKLCEATKKKLEAAFEIQQTSLYKLSAYMPICRAMLDLGPAWLDRFVRETLVESLALAIETAIVAGTGKDQPIGILKDLAGSVVEGVYSDKATTALADLKPATLGKSIMAPLTKNGARIVDDVLLIVNPTDYWEKIFPETTILSNTGQYVYGVLPIPAKVIQSAAMPKGKMVAGLGQDYFMGVGSTQQIEESDHYKFLEGQRTYLAHQYANGKPKDNTSFLVFDISKLGTPVV